MRIVIVRELWWDDYTLALVSVCEETRFKTGAETDD